ncbi:chloramphenicol phosphotransferase CPT family protein [Cerasicoccus frondis]|uniref:chloramphenicol phosphotransferase CPT family protein n=1 Tax=Cerasicoccus frondis TaxID=490090 RepID=UPI002852C56D|nr:hypothetical protein [Cerasicoccus frondis]
MPHPPPVLFLNGTSSVGKTTMAKEFQRQWGEPTLYASIDSFIFMFPQHVLDNDEVRKQVLWPLIGAFNKSLPNIVECGFPVIIDYVMESRVWLEQCLDSLAGFDVYFVGVECPLEELERREKERGDRQVGFARWQNDRVHQYGAYDLVIDTGALTPEACATKLCELLKSGTKPTAFDRLRDEGKKEK